MLTPEIHELLAEVASLYYEEGLTQNEIGARLNLSRVKVYRMLKQAKDEQIVTVLIDWPVKRDLRLERELCRAFGLAEAHVMQTLSNDTNAAFHQLGQMAARGLEALLRDGTTMTVCLGRSTYETINAIRPGFRARVRVVPALGSIPFAVSEWDSAALARRLAQKLGGEAVDLPAPAMADNAAAAAVLRSQRDIRRALEVARAAEVALVGVGNLDPARAGLVRGGFLSSDDVMALTAAGAVGDIAWRIFTDEGTLHANGYHDRIIGLDLDALRRIPMTVVVAAGPAKARAVAGALRTGCVDILCTDDRTADAVLAMQARSEPAAR